MALELRFGASVSKDLRKFDPPTRGRLLAKAQDLRDEPLDRTQVKSMKGMPGYFRYRVLGDYRIIFTVDDKVVTIHLIGDRKDVYERLKRRL